MPVRHSQLMRRPSTKSRPQTRSEALLLGRAAATNTGAARASPFEYPCRVARDPAKQDVLIVSHQASRTDAPILTLNIAESLSARYNVTSLCLTGGEILDDFCAVSQKVINANLRSMELELREAH